MIGGDAGDLTRDAFFGGRLTIAQPRHGHRAGTDAVLLAAAVSRDTSGLVCDVGAGVGVAGLGIALTCPSTRVRLVERDRLAARLAEENITANGLEGRCDVMCCDVLKDRLASSLGPADVVVTNPPFWQPDQVRASPDPGRSAAHVLGAGTTLGDWLVACLDMMSARGTLIVLHAPPAIPDMLATLQRRLGGITLLPVQPQPGAPAKRVLLRGIKGSRAPFAVAPSLVLHLGGRFTPEAERLHRGEAALSW